MNTKRKLRGGLTEPQAQVLRNILAGKPPFEHLEGKVSAGGISGTSRALIQRGYVLGIYGDAPKVTMAGEDALADLDAAPKGVKP